MIEPTRAEMRAELHRMQGGRCAICGVSGTLQMDHDHRTGMARGLLCQPCNIREGKGNARPEICAYRAGPPAAAFKWLWKLPDWWKFRDATQMRELGLSLTEYIEAVSAQRQAEDEGQVLEAIRILTVTDLPALST